MFNGIFAKAYKALKALATRKLTIDFDRIPHRFDDVPFKKILNWILVEASVSLRPSRPWGITTHIQIEPTNQCNLKCPICPVTDGMDRPAGQLDINVYKKLIDEIGEYLLFGVLIGWGEPFLNPSIYEMISYANKKGIKTITSTNGHALENPENAERVVRSGLDTLIVSIDGTTQATYERYRRGGNLDAVLRGIRNIARLKRELKSKTPLINLRFLVMKHNEGDLPGLEDFARRAGADALTLMKLDPYIDDGYSERGLDRNLRDEEYLPDNSMFKRLKKAPDGKTLVRLRQNPCKQPWNYPSLNLSGTISPCCLDFSERYPMGDLKKDSFKDIWYGAPFRKIRAALRSGWEGHSFCGKCNYGFEGGNIGKEAVTGAVFFNPEGDENPDQGDVHARGGVDGADPAIHAKGTRA